MPLSNDGKWHNYPNGVILDGPSGSNAHNLNSALQENLGDELDTILADAIGSAAVVNGLAVTTPGGLAVNVGSGVGYIGGQRTRAASQISIGGLPSSTSGIKIYVEALPTFSTTLNSWPVAAGFVLGSLTADQMQVAALTTDGSSVTVITDMRVLLKQLINGPTGAEKAALAGTSGAPSGTNKYVTNGDTRLTAIMGLPGYLEIQSPDLSLWRLTISNIGVPTWTKQ